MIIHKEGYKIIGWILVPLGLIVLVINLVFPVQTPIHYILYAIGVLFYITVIRFFRKPDRKGVTNDLEVISAADGEVMVIEEVLEQEYFNDRKIQVSVFMSLFNVHVNLFPVSGIIKYLKHHPGKHFLAFLPKASLYNEHHSVVVESSKGDKIMVRQIAGAVARRIVCYSCEGDRVDQRQEIGIIKFGSRVDLFLPLDAEILVHLHQKTRGGKTVMARLPQRSE